MASPDELMRAVEDFRDTLHGMSWQGVSRIADLAQLKVLVTRYPDDARAFLNDVAVPAADNARQDHDRRGER